MKRNLKILVADHDQEFLMIAAKKLSQRNFTVMHAQSAESAIDIIKNEAIDAVVLNFNNANKDGMIVIEFINSLKKKPLLLPLSNDGFEFFETQLA